MRSLLLIATLGIVASPAHAQAPFDKSPIKDWKAIPKPTKEPTFKPPVVKRSKLKNGMALLLVENHALPIVSMQLLVPGAGGAADPAAKAGVASFTADMLDEGAGGMSPIALSEETDRLGASITMAVDSDDAYVAVSTLTKTLDATLELVGKIVTQPTFDPKEFDRVRGDRMTSLELRRDRPREVARIMLDAALYGRDSAYGHPTGGTRETFKDIAIADLQTFYKEHWNPSVATLVVVGDFNAKALRAKLETTLGAWKQPGAKKPVKAVAKAQAVDKRLLLVDRKDKRYYAVEVLASTLGGGFTSRLNQRLREQLGITYGVRSSFEYRVATGPFVIGTAIVTKETGTGLSEITKMLDTLATTDVPPEELDKSKQNLIRALPAQFETNAATAASIADLVHLGLPDNWYAGYAAAIRRITAKDVKAAAKVVPSKSMVFAIVGDLSKIKPDLDKLGLGAPLMHDLYGVPVAK